MGPTLIFDKSVLESLNPDEAVWLDNFYLSNLTPLFFVETLADLEKAARGGRTPEDVVGSLAYKTPDESSKCNVHHTTLLAAELSGSAQVEIGLGRPIISGGQAKELGGRLGVIFQQSPEEEAFQRWQRHEFLELDRTYAKVWRRALSHINLEENYRSFQRFFPLGRPKTLADVKRMVDFYLGGPDQEVILSFGLSLMGYGDDTREAVLSRWRGAGRPSISTFAPYFAHVYGVDLFFNLALAADLVGRGRASHKVDLAYLYYLPFCTVFTSNDKLHVDLVPFFLRENQTFVPGSELKADLAKLDAHYDAFPEEVKKRGLMSFAFYPPPDDSFLISRLWDRHMASDWRERQSRPSPPPDPEAQKKLLQQLERLRTEGRPVAEGATVDSDRADHMVIERKVYPRKGKWNRFPPEITNRRRNEQGEWEDAPPSTLS